MKNESDTERGRRAGGAASARRVRALGGLLCGLWFALPTPAWPEASATVAPASERALDAELLRQIDEAARLEREFERAREAERRREREERARRAADDSIREESRVAEQRARAAAYRRQIERQEAVQAQLLLAMDERSRTRPGFFPDSHAEAAALHARDTDPRIATPAPPLRALPSEIFDSRRVRIAAGLWGNAEPLALVEQSLDADSDGKPELLRWIDPASDQLVRQQEDRDYDGVPDAWSRYDANTQLVSRVLDENDDGSPDVWERYEHGLLVAREIDRDDDGVRDAFYRYRDGRLMQERHDADNDGSLDLVIRYAAGRRVRAEEDSDRDGRMDTWTRYAGDEAAEYVVRIERDRHGRGFADTFEIYERDAGRSRLVRREEDIDADGKIDVVSFYSDGKLRRRQIDDPSLTSL